MKDEGRDGKPLAYDLRAKQRDQGFPAGSKG